MVQVVAEIGSTHDGSIGNALVSIELAAKAGADAVKFQTHIAKFETLRDAPTPEFFSSEPRYDYFNRTGFNASDWQRLIKCAEENRVSFISSPFSAEAAAFLINIGCRKLKIASGEVTNTHLLRYVADVADKVYLSSGMSDWDELAQAYTVLRNKPTTVMQCTSIYPCPEERVGINLISEIANRFGCDVGFSDHTNSAASAVLAVAAGASTIEKHFTISRLLYGSDAKYSFSPAEFSSYVSEIRAAQRVVSNPVDKDDLEDLHSMRRVFQKSIVSKREILRGQILEEDDIIFLKPGTGIPPTELHTLIGRAALRDIPSYAILSRGDFA